MVRWPGDKERAEEVYHDLNEICENYGGTYPVGLNGCWHSGIHIYLNAPVYPVTNGTLIACRINKEYIQLTMPDTINETEHRRLGDRQGLYKEERAAHGGMIYRLADKDAKDRATGGFMLIKHKMYLPAKEGGGSSELEFFSLYMNLRPYNDIPVLQKYGDEFQAVEEAGGGINAIKQAPFYIKWLFKGDTGKINSLEELEFPFKEINGKKVFPLSRFKAASNIYEGGSFKGEFENVPGHSADIDSAWVDFDQMKKRYIPGHAGVKVYSIRKPEGALADDYLLTSLKDEGPYFTGINRHPGGGPWNYAAGYFQVNVFPNEVNDSLRELGLYLPELTEYYKGLNTIEAVNDKIGTSSNYECTKADDKKIVLKVKNELTGQAGPIPYEFKICPEGGLNYKIVKLTDFLRKLERIGWIQNIFDVLFDKTIEYNDKKIKIDMGEEGKDLGSFVKSITIDQAEKSRNKDGRLPVDSNKLVILLKEGMTSFNPKPEAYQENENQMAFYYGGQQINPYAVKNSIFDEFGDSEPAVGLSAYYVTPQAKLFWAGAYLEIPKNADSFSCSCLKSGGGLLPCRISFDGDKSSVLVKATDLKCEYAYGQVKAGSDFFQDKIKGLPVYDDVKKPDDGPDNMRAVITADEEFSLEQAGRFLEAGAAQNRHAISYEGARRYVAIDDKSLVKMKAGVDVNKYGEDNTVAFPVDEKIDTGSILGYPTRHKQYTNVYFYDFVVFFKNKDFMNNAEGLHSDIFIIPEGVKIYKEKETEKTKAEYLFPPDTVFSYEEIGKKDGGAVCKLMIKSMELYIIRADEKTEGKGAVVGEEVEIGEFSTIEVFNSYITYGEQGNVTDCKDERVKAFAEAFGAIRNMIKGAKLLCTGEYKKEGENELEKRFLIDFSEYGNFKLIFWIEEKEMRGKVFEKGEGTFKYPRKDNNGDVLILTVYDKNPLEVEFEEEEREGELSGVLELKKTTDEKVDEAQTKYLGFSVSGEVIYAAESEVTKENLLEWGKYFTVFEEVDNDIVCDNPVENRIRREGWDSLREYELKQEIRKEKRKIVCRHPLEWDKEQYKDSNIRGLMFWGNEERHRLLLEKMEAIEIWGHIKGHGDIRQERNNFWYGHPVYFINHLERAGLLRHPRIDELLAVQDEVMALECLIQGHDGIYGIGKTGETFCNHAAYVTIRAVDANFRNFTNRKGTAFPEYTNSDENILEDNAPSSYNYRLSNYWCHVLEQQALRSNLSGIVEVNAKEAQEYANNGYVVIGALADLSGPDKHPHFVTVRPNPGNQYDPLGGPVVAHVGSSPNEERTAQGAYGNGEEWKNVHWYYNQRQEFIFDLSYINELKRRK